MKKETDTRFIKQRTSNDCGIASLAMLYQQPYSVIRKLILARHNKSTLHNYIGTTADDAKYVGEALGDPAKRWIVVPRNKADLLHRLIDRRAVLRVPGKPPNPDNEGHAVYWDGKHCFDPNGPDHVQYARNGAKALETLTECWVLSSDDV